MECIKHQLHLGNKYETILNMWEMFSRDVREKVIAVDNSSITFNIVNPVKAELKIGEGESYG